MSSFTRRIQKSANKRYTFKGRGCRLGVTFPKAKDLLARLAREERHGSGSLSTL